MGVIRWRPDTREPYLDSYHGGCDPETIRAETGFSLDCDDAVQTRPPIGIELDLLRRVVDPGRVFIDG
jgi:hypothetical protein